MLNHTPTPWSLARRHRALLIVGKIEVPGLGERERVIAATSTAIWNELDMRHICACVNYCQGLTTGYLESHDAISEFGVYHDAGYEAALNELRERMAEESG